MRYILLAHFLLFIGYMHANDTNNRFHVCTVATGAHKNLEKLKHTCEKHQIELHVIGMGRPYYGNATKFIYFAEYLESLDDEDIVMFIDAHDVLIVADKQEILDKFMAMHVPFVMAAEKNAFPDIYTFPYPPSPTPFRYINSGTYIGYVGIIKQWISALQPIDIKGCDQFQTIYHYFTYPDQGQYFILDYYCELFLPLYGVKDEELFIDWFRHRIYNKLTDTFPCVIHANGGSFKIWHQVFDNLYAR